MSNEQTDDRLQVEIVKNFDVPPGKVFDAWIDPKMLGRWMVGPDLREEEVLTLETDPKVGGTFSLVVRREGEVLDHKGTYRVADRPNQLVFTWGVNEEAGDESVVTIDIEGTDTGCRLRLVHKLDPKWKEYIDRTKKGWSEMLDKLKTII